MKITSSNRCFAGNLHFVAHAAKTTHCEMRFSIYVPDAVTSSHRAPVLWWLSGLTCTADNFTTKAGAYRAASELGLIIVAPDTSPRGADIADDDAYDLGQGAGFYLDAVREPWAPHFSMYSYLLEELPALVFDQFPADDARQGISGHSMGGHGALTLGLKNPSLYRSISAFAPIVAPTQCPWGEKAFREYLGSDQAQWVFHDACALMAQQQNRSNFPTILIDQGLNDEFLEPQLKPRLFASACAAAGQALTLRMQEGHDHSYYFIASFIDDHLHHHAQILAG